MCTGIRLKAKNNAVVYARTLEFGQDLQSRVIVIPRNYQFVGITPTGKADGLSWKSRHAVVGMNALGLDEIIDGVNEQGLAGGLFYFPDYAGYQDVAQERHGRALAPWQLMTWILTTCSTVAEVKAALLTITVSNAILPQWGFTPPVHGIVHDAQGNCLVIEYVNGQLCLYDNPLGVVTNAPTFDWHITNLRNYINLSALNVPQIKLGDIVLHAFGQGSGMLGLPGDFTPPSRFVRAVAFSQSIPTADDETDAVAAAFHVLNLFDIPIGIVREKVQDALVFDCTQWTSASDLKNKRFYMHTYHDRQVQAFNLMDMDLEASQVMRIT